jgi:hypothetical protein
MAKGVCIDRRKVVEKIFYIFKDRKLEGFKAFLVSTTPPEKENMIFNIKYCRITKHT